jgi:hypothetical protein
MIYFTLSPLFSSLDGWLDSSHFMPEGLIHVLLVIALIAIIFRIIRGKKLV